MAARGFQLWLRFSIVRYHFIPVLVPLWIFDLAFRPTWFQAALYGLLCFNATCCLGSLWLALKR
jgi:hypothetical protein